MTNVARKKTPLKLFLVIGILVSAAVIVYIFMGYRRMINNPEKLISMARDGASVSLEKFRQTATRNGVKEWYLDADSAKYIDKNRQALFENLSMVFYLANEKKISLSADKGVLQTESNNIDVTGNVVVSDGKYRLATDNLSYNYAQRELVSQTPVKITGDALHLTADSVVYSLNNNKTYFKGNVRGSISGWIGL